MSSEIHGEQPPPPQDTEPPTGTVDVSERILPCLLDPESCLIRISRVMRALRDAPFHPEEYTVRVTIDEIPEGMREQAMIALKTLRDTPVRYKEGGQTHRVPFLVTVRANRTFRESNSPKIRNAWASGLTWEEITDR